MARLRHRHRGRIDALGDHHQSLGHDPTTGCECRTHRRQRSRRVPTPRRRARRFRRLAHHPGELGQAGDAVGVDRTTEVSHRRLSQRRRGVHTGHGLDGESVPYGQQTQELGRQPYGAARRASPPPAASSSGVVRAALERRSCCCTEREGLGGVSGCFAAARDPGWSRCRRGFPRTRRDALEQGGRDERIGHARSVPASRTPAR